MKIQLKLCKWWDKDFKQVVLPTISFFYDTKRKNTEIDIAFFIWNLEICIWRAER